MAQDVFLLLLLHRKLCSYPQQQTEPVFISKRSIRCPKALVSTPKNNTNKQKTLFQWSPLWHTSKPATTKNGLPLREACLTPVWPRCLLSPPSLLQRTQDLRRRGGKLIPSSWRQWQHVCVCFQALFLLLTAYTRACTRSQTCTWVTVSLIYCLDTCVSHTNTGKGPPWSHLDSRLPFHQSQ